VHDELTRGLDRRWPPGSLLARLQPSLREELLRRCRTTRYAPGQLLLRQGATDRHALVLIDGEVKVHMLDSSGFDAVLAIRRRGDLVGELAALTDEPRTATVVAVTPVSAGVILGDALIDFLTVHPQAAREVIRTQARRLEWANRRRIDFASRKATVRVARALVDLAREDDGVAGGPIRVELTQRELASLVGIALNTAELALRSLAEAELIDRRYRAVLVIDLPALATFADRDPDNP
jgi:CRP/FNR family cyclic AMP-dependent transcriptional regulator